MGDVLRPGSRSGRFSGFFAGYCRRMLRRDFASVRLALGSGAVLRTLGDHDGPAIVAMNHASWWDPLVGLVLADRFVPGRHLASPIELEQFERFGFMKRLGMFGIDHRSPDALDAFADHAVELFECDPETLLGVTPQGAFTDVREPVRPRPGVAVAASRLAGDGHAVRVVSVACEYTFWSERRPELLIRAEACGAPETYTVAAWTRAITRAMRSNASSLASLSIARDGDAFEPLLGRSGPGVNLVYDLLLRLRGKSSRIEPGVDRRAADHAEVARS